MEQQCFGGAGDNYVGGGMQGSRRVILGEEVQQKME